MPREFTHFVITTLLHFARRARVVFSLSTSIVKNPRKDVLQLSSEWHAASMLEGIVACKTQTAVN